MCTSVTHLRPCLHRVLDRHAHQALGSGDGNRLDADAGIEADLLLAALQHVFVEELDHLCQVSNTQLSKVLT